MKIAYILIAMLVVFMVGCATTQTEPAETTQTEPAETPDETAPPVEEAAPVGGDVTFNGRGGYDPEEVTIAAGSTLSIMVSDDASAQYSFRVIETAQSVTQVEDGQIAELAFEEAGSYTVMSVPLMKKLTVTVE